MISPRAIDLHAVENTPALWIGMLPPVSRDAHKYLRGHCLVVSGPELRTGASRLAAIAALNNGAGVVTIAGDKNALRIHAAHVTAVMLQEATNPEDFATLLAARRFDSLIIGPASGVGEATLARIRAAASAAVPLVLDADALTSLVGNIEQLHTPDWSSTPCVMTPHAGEFDRLFAPLLACDKQLSLRTHQCQQWRIESALAAARISKAVIVLKGAETVIASPDGRAAVNGNAGAELATAGSGDVLSGLIGAHLAGGMPPFEAAAAAVWLHGLLGARIGIGLTADRLVDAVRPLPAFL